MQPSRSFDDLVKLVRILRKECPWDRKQTHQSIKDNLIEEAYEAIEAIDDQDMPELEKELGDVLLHVVFHSVMAHETDDFQIGDVIYTLMDKLIRRHPHVFGDVDVDNESEVAENWESIKQQEGRDSVLDGIPKHLPALIRAQRMQEKAANVGFDWPERAQVWDKVREEIEELEESVEAGQGMEAITDEFGDVLFSLVNAARFMDLNAEDALRMTIQKFEKRFRYVEEQIKLQGGSLNESDLATMDRYWNEAKNQQG
jgi:XTP/dITP diphosphohydrolase